MFYRENQNRTREVAGVFDSKTGELEHRYLSVLKVRSYDVIIKYFEGFLE